MATGIRASRREDVLRLVDESEEPLTIAALADRLGMHPSTVRFHLERLVADGRIEMTKDARGQRGRPAQLFGSANDQAEADARRYRMLAEILVDALGDRPDPVGAATDAGRRWGRREAESIEAADPVAGLVDVLDRIGFGPQVADDAQTAADAQVNVCHCPFLELALERPDVVCSVHLGIMQGALAVWDENVTVSRLVRHERPEPCVAHLAMRGDEGAGAGAATDGAADCAAEPDGQESTQTP
ncbi:helix-turn-helix transcriptional regulator [Microbacterium sp.]|uniref:helix-turn-helix transcriptional regulator n=1 Tax=Microbacterium sp. TaxID=51671 RepID=UPI003A94EC1F